MSFRRLRALGWVALLALLVGLPAHAGPTHGKLSGVVVDPRGTPQMGATVWVMPEDRVSAAAIQLLTNQHGAFAAQQLLPGFYSVRVTLAGFLPSIARHVRISPNGTTLLKIELDSVFASLDRLRRGPQPETDADEWKWVLRAAAATRPVLQWVNGEVIAGGEVPAREGRAKRGQRGRVELTSGARHPGSVSNLADAPTTAFSYKQKIGHVGQLLLAGQMSYERSASAGIATMWLPSGELGNGSQTSVVLRQSKLGPAGPAFRGLRLDHASTLPLGERITLHYGAEYIMVGLGSSTTALRPRATFAVRLTPKWRASMIVASRPSWGDPMQSSVLQAALAQLDAFPALLWRNGRPVLEGGWHEELALQRRLASQASLTASVYHDRSRHLAVFGRGATPNPEFLRDAYSDAFLYDGGASNSWGTRIAFKQKISDDFDIAAVYAWAGALAVEDVATDVDLRDALQTRYRHSLAARVSGRVPRLGTQVVTSYKWVSGSVVTRQDNYGEAAYQLEPYLNLAVRQPLPSFGLCGKWEALADFHNLLAQGYSEVNGRDGQMRLVPVLRSFRGGFSFQF